MPNSLEFIRRAKPEQLPVGAGNSLDFIRQAKPGNSLDFIKSAKASDPVSVWHGQPTPATAVSTTPSRRELGAEPEGFSIGRFARGFFRPPGDTQEAENERIKRAVVGTPEKPTWFTPETPERPTTPAGYMRQAYQEGGALGAAGEVAKMGVLGPLYGAFKQRDTPPVQAGELFEPGTEARGIAEAVSHFATPTNAAIIAGASTLTGIPAIALSAYFATDMGVGAYQTAGEIAKAKSEGREDDARELTGQLMVMIPAALGAAGHAGKKTVGIIGDRSGRIRSGEPTTQPPEITSVDAPAVPPSPIAARAEPLAGEMTASLQGGQRTLPFVSEADLRPPPPPAPPGVPPQGPGGPAVPPTPPGAGRLPESESWVQKRIDLEDRLYPVKAMEKMARDPLSIEESAYHRMRMYPAVFARAQSHLETLRKGLKPIRQTFREDIKSFITDKKPADLVSEFERYATNAHELDVQQVYPERQFSGGRTREQIIQEQRDIQQRLGPDKMARLNQAQRAYSEFGHRMLDELVDAGAFSRDVAARLKQAYPRYVPLERVLAEAEGVLKHPGTGGGRSMSVSTQNVVRKLTEQGSELEIQRALETMSRKAFDAFSLAERNRASRAVYDLAGKEEFAGTVIRLRPEADPPPGMVRSSVLIDGVRHDYAVPRQVGEAIQGLTKTQADVVTEMAGKSAQALRAGATTWSLPFLGTNIARDYYTASMRSPVGFTPLDMIAGFYHGLKKDALYHDYLRSGAAMSGFFEQFKTPQREARHLVESQATRNMKKILNPFELMSEIGQAGENAARIGLYRRGKQAGLSEMEAGWLGRDTTVDFAKSGRVIRVLNILTPFINARIQGSGNMLRTFRDNPGEASLTWWALIGGPLTALYLYNTRNHPEAYRDMQPYTEEAYYPLITGDEKDEDGSYPGFKFPMEEFGQLGARSLLAALQHLDENDPVALNKLASRMGLSGRELQPGEGKKAPSAAKVAFETATGLLPVDVTPGGDVGLMPALRGTASGLLPPIARGALEAGTGTSFFTGRPIGKLQSMRDLPEAEKYIRGETPEWLVSVGKWTDTSPERLKHIIESQFATVGRLATRGETPTGQVAKRFSGIPGGAVESKGFQRTSELRGQAAMERMETTAPAEQAFKELKAIPKDQMAAAFREKIGQLPRESRFVLLDLIAKDAGGLTREEQSLKAQLIGVRAKRLLEKMQELPQDQIQGNINRWAKGGLLTKDTLRMMRQIQAAEAQGVEPKLRQPRR